jgi:hypothetical protein
MFKIHFQLNITIITNLKTNIAQTRVNIESKLYHFKNIFFNFQIPK